MTKQFRSKKARFSVVLIGSMLITLLSVKVFGSPNNMTTEQRIVSLSLDNESELKLNAFVVLKNKCNTCHRKKNPFMIFSEKNMNRRAPKIKRQVFELQRMPKKSGTPLTQSEYSTLKKWIDSL